ncbi:MAG TPA: SRPBCC family protein [Ktedonobacterales bacterium]
MPFDEFPVERSLTITRILPASRQAVFDAWTDEASVRQWMCPEGVSVAQATLDVRVGGAFRVDMLINGERLAHTGHYREVEPPERLAFTWISKDTRQRDTLVTITLVALSDNSTELRLTQTLLPDDDSVRDHTQGWTEILEHLASTLGGQA